MESRNLALLCRDLAENKKAENIVVLDVRKVSTITDYFVIASGNNEPHLRAIANEITDKLRQEHELRPRAIDGDSPTAWQVLDFFDVIVHLMRNDVREKYDLESLWGDAPKLKSGAGSRKKAPEGGRPKAKTKAVPAWLKTRKTPRSRE